MKIAAAHVHLGLSGCLLLAGAIAACTLDAAGTASEGSGGAGATTTTTTTTTSNTGGGCASPIECPGADGDCSARTCNGGVCGESYSPFGTACNEGGGEVCDGSGHCEKDLGTSCASAGECASNACADGVCCDDACDGACEACDTSPGQCTPVVAGADPDSECGGGVCDGARACAEGTTQWARAFGDPAWDDDEALDVAVDAQGNVIIVGFFDGNLDFGCGTVTSGGWADAFAAKLSPDGDCLWSRGFGDSNYQVAFGVAVDGQGNVLVVGRFAGNIDLGAGLMTGAGGWDAFVAKLDPDGNALWSKRWGDSANQEARAVAADASGNLRVIGSFAGTTDFDGTVYGASGIDAFVVDLGPTGSVLWAKAFGGNNNQEGVDIAVDANGNALFAGRFRGDIDMGGGALTAGLGQGIVVAKLSPAGTHTWSHAYGDATFDADMGAVAVDGSGNAALACTIRGSVDFGGGPLVTAGVERDACAFELDATGNHVWSRAWGDLSAQGAVGIATDAGGNVVLAGYNLGTMDLGGGPLQAAQLEDVFVAKLARDGTHLWSRQLVDGGSGLATAVATGPAAEILLTGYFTVSIDYGLGPLPSGGAADAHLGKLAP